MRVSHEDVDRIIKVLRLIGEGTSVHDDRLPLPVPWGVWQWLEQRARAKRARHLH